MRMGTSESRMFLVQSEWGLAAALCAFMQLEHVQNLQNIRYLENYLRLQSNYSVFTDGRFAAIEPATLAAKAVETIATP